MPEFRTLAPSDRRRLFLLGGLWLAAFSVLILFHSAVLPFAGAALIAYLVQPHVTRLSRIEIGRWKVPRWTALLIVYGIVFLTLYVFFITVFPRLYGELTRISRDLLHSAQSLTPERTAALTVEFEAWLVGRGLPPTIARGSSANVAALLNELAQRTGQLIEQNLFNIVRMSRLFVGSVLAGVFTLFFMLMVAAFFSIDSAKIGAYVRTLIPPEYAQDIQRLVQRIDRSLDGVVRGQITICLVNGVLTLIGLWIFKVHFAFILATLATILSLVPIFGTILSSIPIVLVALVTGWKTALAMLAWIVGIHALEAYFLNPKIMGEAARIHPVIVAFSLLAGERSFGIVGALLAVPVAAIVVACFEFVRQKAQPAAGGVAAG
ncbi:MAG: AI-2E family transporter [Myxococcaceae bacterium]